MCRFWVVGVIVIAGCSSSSGAWTDLDSGSDDIHQLDASMDATDLCIGVTCYANALCDEADGQCVCDEGYENWAERVGCRKIPLSLCDGVVCFNNAHCDTADGTCICNEGFEGWAAGQGCTEIPGTCDGVVCFNNAHCDTSDGRCVCNEGFENWIDGQGCAEIPGTCDGVVCFNNAHCDTADGTCICNEGFEGWAAGLGCTEIPGMCDGVVCFNNAHCDTSDGRCVCNEGFENWIDGQGCTEIPGTCDGVVCFNNAHCDTADGQCVCNEGFENWIDGLGCAEIPGTCDGVVCFSNAHCDTADGQCVCNDGYKNWSVGIGCLELVEPCDSVICGTMAHCEPMTAVCVCDNGYMGDPAVGCAAGCLPDQLEDDDTSDAATVVELPYLSGTLSSVSAASVRDYDWFAFDLEAGDTVMFGAYFSQLGGDIDLGLFSYAAPNDINDGQIALGWLSSVDDNEFGRFTAKTTGTYYVQVVPVTADMCGTYTFVVDYVDDPCSGVTCGGAYEECVADLDAEIAPRCDCTEGYLRNQATGECVEWCPPDSLEQNDSPLEATAVVSPFDMTGLTRMSQDGDWFAIEATEGSLIIIDAAFDHGAANLELYLHDGDNINMVPAYSVGVTDHESIAYTVPAGQGGNFLLEVTLNLDDCGVGDFCSVYDLSITVTDGAPCDGACSGAEQRCRTVIVEPYYECYCRTGFIWNETGDACEDDPCLPAPCPENAACVPDETAVGDFRCDCLDGYIDDGAGGCTLICDEDALAPNQTSAQATIIGELPWSANDLGAINQGTGFMEGSHDWFKITLAPGEMVKVDVTFVVADGDIDINLFDYPATNSATDYIATSAGSDDNESLMWFSESGGDLYLRVRPYTVGMCNLYDILIQTVPDPCVSRTCLDANAECVPSLFIQNGYSCNCLQGYQYDPAYESCELYCTDDSNEDNDSRTAATSVALPFLASSLKAMNTSDRDDEDWFVFTLDAGTDIQIDASFLYADGDIDLYLYFEDDTSAPVAIARHYGNNEQIVYQAAVSGRHFLKVVPADNFAQCTSYGLSIAEINDL